MNVCKRMFMHCQLFYADLQEQICIITSIFSGSLAIDVQKAAPLISFSLDQASPTRWPRGPRTPQVPC